MAGFSRHAQTNVDLGMRALRAHGSAFAPIADNVREGFAAKRSEIAASVKAGRTTTTVAREQAAALAKAGRAAMMKARGESIKPSPYLATIASAIDVRAKIREGDNAVAVGRETNRLLASLLMETSLASRAAELEARATVRGPMGSPPMPADAGALLALFDEYGALGDETGIEHIRRSLAAVRPVTFGELADRSDAAMTRPGAVNPATLRHYLDVLPAATPAELDAFLGKALKEQHSTALAAFYIHSRGDGTEVPPILRARLHEFSDGALDFVHAVESAAFQAELGAADALIASAGMSMDADAAMPGLPVSEEERQLAASERIKATAFGGVNLPRPGVAAAGEVPPNGTTP